MQEHSADLVEELKAKIIKELETILLIINAHNLLEGAATFSIVSVADLDLNIPFDALYVLKDEPEKMRSTLLEKLRLHLESIAPYKVISIPLIKGSKFTCPLSWLILYQ